MGNDDKEGFRVVDRRRFDESGQEKLGEEAVKTQETPIIESTEGKNSGEPLKENPSFKETSDFNFSSFVISLATQALMQLGAMEAPAGVNIEVDHHAAKQTIDIISMLKEKTKGNLDSQEENLIEDILHELRMGYVRVLSAGNK